MHPLDQDPTSTTTPEVPSKFEKELGRRQDQPYLVVLHLSCSTGVPVSRTVHRHHSAAQRASKADRAAV